MLIGELSKRTGFSRDAIWFYEKQGLIKVGRRDRRINNYKEYSEDVLKRLLLFRKIKSYGFSLNESAEMIALVDANLASCDVVSKTVNQKIKVIDQKIQDLINLRNVLKSSIERCATGCCDPSPNDNCPIFELDNKE